MPYHNGRRAVGMGIGPIHLLGGGELSQRLAGLGVHAESEEIDPVDEGLPEMTRVIELGGSRDQFVLPRRPTASHWAVYLHVDLDSLDTGESTANE
jgi:hypothetical protein